MSGNAFSLRGSAKTQARHRKTVLSLLQIKRVWHVLDSATGNTAQQVQYLESLTQGKYMYTFPWDMRTCQALDLCMSSVCASQHEKRQASSIPCSNIALPVRLKEEFVNFLSITNLNWIPENIKKCPNSISRHRIQLTLSTAIFQSCFKAFLSLWQLTFRTETVQTISV